MIFTFCNKEIFTSKDVHGISICLRMKLIGSTDKITCINKSYSNEA